jgi:hypothetical protein
MRYKIFGIVENFFGLKGQEREKRKKRTRFFKAVAEPPHFFAPFFAAKQRENEKDNPELVGA